jgi:hypothetical protein
MIAVARNRYIKALVITLIYVGVGTFSVCSVYPSDAFSGMWALFGLILTLPVSIISFSYRYANAQNLQPIFVIQAIMLVPTYLFIVFVFLKNKKPKETP